MIEPDSSSLHNILIIEADPLTRLNLEVALMDCGYRVYAASTGAVATAYLQSLPLEQFPACIILDAGLHDEDKSRVLHALSRDPALAEIPLIYSVLREAGEVPVFLAPFNVVRKPYHLPELIEIIVRCLRSSL